MDTQATGSSTVIPSWRQWSATAILVVAALGAIYAFVAAASSIDAAGSEAFVVETWRMFGFLVFAGTFLLLAYRPRLYPGIWELAIFHKAAVATFLVAFGDEAVDGTSTAVTDGVLALALVVAYLLVGGYRSWDRIRSPTTAEENEASAG